jgi:hypothetical protein
MIEIRCRLFNFQCDLYLYGLCLWSKYFLAVNSIDEDLFNILAKEFFFFEQRSSEETGTVA